MKCACKSVKHSCLATVLVTSQGKSKHFIIRQWVFFFFIMKFTAFTKTRMWYLLIGRFYIPVFRFNITNLFYFYFLCIIKS